MTDIHELIRRIEGAKGPDREIDGAIAKAVGSRHGPEKRVSYESRSVEYIQEVARRYTASIDAAMTLVPDNWTAWELRSHSARTRFSADLSRLTECDATDEDWAVGRGTTPALAICAAALRARITQERSNG